jgi:hypothetical protein
MRNKVIVGCATTNRGDPTSLSPRVALFHPSVYYVSRYCAYHVWEQVQRTVLELVGEAEQTTGGATIDLLEYILLMVGCSL